MVFIDNMLLTFKVAMMMLNNFMRWMIKKNDGYKKEIQLKMFGYSDVGPKLIN